MNVFNKIILIIALAFAIGTSVFGDQSDFYNRTRGDEQWGVSVGFGNNHKIPRHTLVPHMEFSVTTFEFEHFISQRTSIGFDLSLIERTNRVDNDAISTSANYTRYFYIHDRFSINYKFGLGIVHMQELVQGQASRTNFDEHLDLGFQYATNSSSSISLAFTLYHASNAGIKQPNDGITATLVQLGYRWRR